MDTMNQQSQQRMDATNAAIARAWAARQARQQAAIDANNLAYRRWIGSKIAAGQCSEARSDALQQGRYDMVEAVDRYCHPPAATQ